MTEDAVRFRIDVPDHVYAREVRRPVNRPRVSTPGGARGDEPASSTIHSSFPDDQTLHYNSSGVAVLRCTVAVNGHRFSHRTNPEQGRKVWRHTLETADLVVSLRYATAEITKVRREQTD